MWSDWQATRAAKQEATRRKSLVDACLNYTAPPDQLVYAEPPTDAKQLLAQTRALTIEQARAGYERIELAREQAHDARVYREIERGPPRR